MASKSGDVDLGFAEDCEPILLCNTYFPSKIGGKPAWLELDNIPKADALECDTCQEPLVFLLQVYASLDNNPNCFHRTIYVFVCRNESCYASNSAKGIRVFRSQLPRLNKFYSYEPPSDNMDEEPVMPDFTLCRVCGCRGPFVCAKCKKAFYCTKLHQKFDWKNCHKNECNTNSMPAKDQLSTFLFLEFDLTLESEEEALDAIEIDKQRESKEEREKRNQDEYERLVNSGQAGVLNDVADSEFSQYANASEAVDDVVFAKFKKTVDNFPEQILRYERDGEPLWISGKNILNKEDIMNCELCGGKRVFEFQIMPQLLNYLKDCRLDWGIIAVYTCEQGCDTNGKYVKEFVYKQDIVDDNVGGDVKIE